MSKKRVLITGAAGFLGSHLCDRFIKEGYHVIGMDNLLTGNIKNIEHLFPLPEFEYYHHDVTKFVHVPGTLDYILFTGASYPTRSAFVLNTRSLSDDVLTATGLHRDDSLRDGAREEWDHLPVVVDLAKQ